MNMPAVQNCSKFSSRLGFSTLATFFTAQSGINNAQKFQKCKTTLADYAEVTTALDPGAEGFLRQVALSDHMLQVIQGGNLDQVASQTASSRIMRSGLAMGQIANEWLPIMRSILVAVAAMLTVILALFLPTPLVLKALGTMVGLWVWITMGGVVNAAIHGIAVDYSLKAYAHVNQAGQGLGLRNILYMPDATMKALGLFGIIRTSGVMLASALTMMLIKFGGYALASMSHGLMGQVSSGAAAGGAIAADPATHAQEAHKLMASPSTMTNPYRLGPDQARAMALDEAAKGEAKTDLVDALGPDGYINMRTSAHTAGEARFSEKGDALREGDLARNITESRGTGAFSERQRWGQTLADMDKYNQHGYPGLPGAEEGAYHLRQPEAERQWANREKLKQYANNYDMSTDQLVRAQEQLKMAETSGKALSLQDMAKNFDGDPYKAMDFYQKFGMQQQFGRMQGAVESWQS